MNKYKSPQFNFHPTPRQIEQIRIIQEEFNLPSRAAAISLLADWGIEYFTKVKDRQI